MLLADHYSRPQLLAMAVAYARASWAQVELTDGWSRLTPALLQALAPDSRDAVETAYQTTAAPGAPAPLLAPAEDGDRDIGSDDRDV